MSILAEWSYVDPSELHESADNPRTITGERFEALMAGINASPEMLEARPIIASTDGDIVGGNMRHRAITAMLRTPGAQYMKFHAYYERHGGVPTYLRKFVSEAEKREWMLRDNNGYGDYVEDELAAFLRAGIEAGMDLTLTGFSDDELNSILKPEDVDMNEGDADVDPDDKPVYGIIIECQDEHAQGELLEEMAGRGYEVRSIL